MEMTEGLAPFGNFRTWYRVCGNSATGLAPLMVVHGGPGLTHDYVEEFAELTSVGRTAVLYDQVGNGRSTRLTGNEPRSWTIQLFVDELANLIRHLGIERRHCVLGQSLGAGVAAEYASGGPSGLSALVLANGYASMRLFLAGSLRLRRELPLEVQDTLRRHELSGTTAAGEYQAAFGHFFARHICRVPMSTGLKRSLSAFASDQTVYRNMYGPSLFLLEGALRDWSMTDRLGRIAPPTLVYRGAYDESVAEAVQPFLARGMSDACARFPGRHRRALRIANCDEGMAGAHPGVCSSRRRPISCSVFQPGQVPHGFELDASINALVWLTPSFCGFGDGIVTSPRREPC